jgi:predicted porin
MKKSLLAVAAMGAFASAAQAQSSVTVYGILDVGYIGSNVRSANNAASTTSGLNQVNAVTKTSTSAFGDSAQSTSRLGFRGREDLGGGLAAFFTLETAITPNAVNAIATAASANRQTFVGLEKKGVGSFAFGTQYTTIFNAASATDPGQFNNMMGNLINDKPTGATLSAVRNSAASSSSSGLGSITQAAATQQFAGNQNNTAFTVRSNNMLSVRTAPIAGIVGNAFYAVNASDANATAVAAGGYTGGQTSNSAWGLGANYTWQKLLVTANFQNFTNKNAYTIAAGAYTIGQPTQNGYGAVSTPGVNSVDNQQYYAATYDFGIVKGYLQFVDRKTMDANNSANYIRRSAQQIGVRGNWTPKIESWASTGTGKLTSSSGASAGGQAVTTYVVGHTGGTSASANFAGFQLGTNYILSKRTNLYAIYGQQSTSNAVWATGAAPTSYNDNNYAVGVRHTF